MSGFEALIPALIGVGGQLISGALSRSAYNDAEDKRSRQLALENQRTNDTQRRNLQTIDQATEQYKPGTREKNLKTNENTATGAFQDYLATEQAKDTGTTPGGKLTAGYLEGAGNAAADRLKYGRNYAQLLGRYGAANTLNQQEGFRMGQAASDIATNNTDRGVDFRLGQAKINSIQPDGGKLFLADAINAGTGAYAQAKYAPDFGALGSAAGGGTITGASPRFMPTKAGLRTQHRR